MAIINGKGPMLIRAAQLFGLALTIVAGVAGLVTATFHVLDARYADRDEVARQVTEITRQVGLNGSEVKLLILEGRRNALIREKLDLDLTREQRPLTTAQREKYEYLRADLLGIVRKIESLR